jgi:hypothetical protein
MTTSAVSFSRSRRKSMRPPRVSFVARADSFSNGEYRARKRCMVRNAMLMYKFKTKMDKKTNGTVT